jgi:TolA-binding protein
MSNGKTTEEKFKFLDIAAKLILIYLALKLIAFPVIRTGVNVVQTLDNKETIGTDSFTIPDLTFPDIILLIIIFLFQPQVGKIFESLDLSTQGLKAKFRDLEVKVDQTKQEIDQLQQQQIDLLTKQQKEIDKLQRFMYRLLLTPKEIEKLQGLKEHSKNNTSFQFYVNKGAASELRRLRDSKLIKIKPPSRYISDLEKASNYAKTDRDFIDLTE